jgi:predicted outer membrane repeat protein
MNGTKTHRRRGSLSALALSLSLFAGLPRAGAAIEVNSDKDVLKVDSLCTLREAVQSAFDVYIGGKKSYPECKGGQDDVITFASAYTIELDPNLGQIPLNSNLTIQGPPSKVTVSGVGKTRIFTTNSLVLVQLRNLKLTKGTVDGGGAAILILGGSALYDIENCDFVDNDSTGGGAVDFHGDHLAIRMSTFIANTSQTFGGGLQAGGDIEIEDTLFDSNLARQGGGGIACASGGDLTILRSAIVANSAFGEKFNVAQGASGGGGIESGCHNDIQDTLFLSNTAHAKAEGDVALAGGGGLYVTAEGSGRVYESVFKTNSAGGGSDQGGSGGGIHARGGLTVDRCVFEQNSAKGGYGGGGILFRDSPSVVVNSLLHDNVSQKTLDPVGKPNDPWDGAGIAVLGDSLVSIVNSTLYNDVGQSELFFLGNSGAVLLKNSLVGGFQSKSTCDGDLLLILAAGNKNAQTTSNATCQDVPLNLGGMNYQPFTFPQAIPGGYDLSFTSMLPAFNEAPLGKGDPFICQNPPVAGIDLLGKTRNSPCTLGAVEK